MSIKVNIFGQRLSVSFLMADFDLKKFEIQILRLFLEVPVFIEAA